jgi:hypothetical protein
VTTHRYPRRITPWCIRWRTWRNRLLTKRDPGEMIEPDVLDWAGDMLERTVLFLQATRRGR